MELKEEMVSQETVYQGIIVNVRRDKAKLPDGRLTNREVVEHPGGVAIFAMDDQDRVALVRQYRYPMGEIVLELPAGKLEKGEDPRDSGLRELREETGLIPGVFESMGVSYSSPGILAERIYLYFAKDLKQGPTQPDDGEFVGDGLDPLPGADGHGPPGRDRRRQDPGRAAESLFPAGELSGEPRANNRRRRNGKTTDGPHRRGRKKHRGHPPL